MTAALTWELADAVAIQLGATAVQRRKWRQIGRQVPDTWRIRIVEWLAARGATVDFKAFDDLPPRPGKLEVHELEPMLDRLRGSAGKAGNHSPRPETARG